MPAARGPAHPRVARARSATSRTSEPDVGDREPSSIQPSPSGSSRSDFVHVAEDEHQRPRPGSPSDEQRDERRRASGSCSARGRAPTSASTRDGARVAPKSAIAPRMCRKSWTSSGAHAPGFQIISARTTTSSERRCRSESASVTRVAQPGAELGRRDVRRRRELARRAGASRRRACRPSGRPQLATNQRIEREHEPELAERVVRPRGRARGRARASAARRRRSTTTATRVEPEEERDLARPLAPLGRDAERRRRARRRRGTGTRRSRAARAATA